MQTYQITLTRSPVIVLILVVLPLVITAAFLVPLIYLPRIPDWLLILLICTMMVCSILAVFTAVKKWGTVSAEAELDERGIRIRLKGRSPFYVRRRYDSSWAGVANVSSNYEPQKGRRFYEVRFREPATTVSLEPVTQEAGIGETVFGTALLGFVAQYNEAQPVQEQDAEPKALISRRGFYDAWWAKGLTVLAYAASVIVVVICMVRPGALPWYKAVQVLSFSAVWLAAYYANRRRKA